VIGRVLPVGAFVNLFRALLESDPLYSDLWLEGEITDLSRSAAGHTYFSLRDEDGALKCVLFRGEALRLPQLPVSGAQVAVHGGLTLYARAGAVQLSVDMLQPAGLGAAALELEYLRQRLAAEGLFDPSRKRPLPEWPRTIGVVTSAHGAAWRDVQAVIGRRYPLVSLVLSSTNVQGDGAAAGIVAALEALQREEEVDLIILARGGGSGDDLSAFNDERVVRAVFACTVPVVAGIGHATDTTLAEDAADVVAPTPSAAAEIAVPSVPELSYRVFTLRERLDDGMRAQRDAATMSARLAAARLARCHPQAQIAAERGRLTGCREALRTALTDRFDGMRLAVSSRGDVLGALDPHAVLRRGYAALHDAETTRPVFSVTQVTPGTRLEAVLADGAFEAVVALMPGGTGQRAGLSR
jgi:exodeoxyribonuclease VII large subunit